MLRTFLKYLCGLFFLIECSQLNASTTSSPDPTPSMTHIISLKVKDIQKIIGRKLTFKEKIGLIFLKQAARHKEKTTPGGNTPLVLGILSIVVLVAALAAPTLVFLSPLLGIAAIITGIITLKKDPGNKNAKTGRLLGWIAVSLFAALLILAAIAFSTGSWF